MLAGVSIIKKAGGGFTLGIASEETVDYDGGAKQQQDEQPSERKPFAGPGRRSGGGLSIRSGREKTSLPSPRRDDL